MMLAVLLMILKIIGIILLSLIGLSLFILLVILFVPITYEISAKKETDFSAKGRVAWLFGGLKAVFVKDKDMTYRLSLFFMTIAQQPKPKKKPKKRCVRKKTRRKTRNPHKRKADGKGAASKGDKAGTVSKPGAVAGPEVKPEAVVKPAAAVKPEAMVKPAAAVKPESVVKPAAAVKPEAVVKPAAAVKPESVVKPAAAVKPEAVVKPATAAKAEAVVKPVEGPTKSNKSEEIPVNKPGQKKRSKVDKEAGEAKSEGRKPDLKQTKAGIKGAREAWERFQAFRQDEGYKGMIPFLLKTLWRLVKRLKPKRISLKAVFGMEEPDQTGYILAGLSMLYAWFGSSISITPDFERKRLEGEVYVKGRIFLCVIAFYAIKILLDKRVRKLIKQMKNQEVT